MFQKEVIPRMLKICLKTKTGRKKRRDWGRQAKVSPISLWRGSLGPTPQQILLTIALTHIYIVPTATPCSCSKTWHLQYDNAVCPKIHSCVSSPQISAFLLWSRCPGPLETLNLTVCHDQCGIYHEAVWMISNLFVSRHPKTYVFSSRIFGNNMFYKPYCSTKPSTLPYSTRI